MTRPFGARLFAAIVIAVSIRLPVAAQEAALEPGELNALMKQLESKDDVAVNVAWNRLKYARAIAPNAARLLQLGNARIDAWTAFALIDLGPSGKSAAEPMLERLATLTPDDDGVELVLRALGSIGTAPDAITRALEQTIRNKPKSDLRSNFLSLSLFNSDPEGKWSVPVIAAVLESDEMLSRHRAAEDLGRHGPRAAQVADALFAAIAYDFPPKQRYRDPGAAIIERNWSPNGYGYDLLRGGDARGWSFAERRFIDYRSPYVWALSQMGPAGKGALARVAEIAAAGPMALRPDAIRAAAMIDPEGSVAFKLLKSGLADANPFIRLAAEDAIRFLGPKAAGARAELAALWKSARPYELRAISRAVEAAGWEDKPVVADLIATILNKKSGAASFPAAHRLGLIEQPDAAVVEALRSGLRSEEPALVCLSILSLGRLAPASAAAAPDLVALLGSIELSAEMNLWDATKAAYAMEALGRLGPSASAALPVLTRMIRAIEGDYFPGLHMPGIDEHLIAKTYWLIRAPTYELKTPIVGQDGTKSDPPWSADWGQDVPDRGSIWWSWRSSPSTMLIEFGPVRARDADWSTIDWIGRTSSNESVLLTITKDGQGALELHLLDWENAIAWARQKATETRPSAGYVLEARMPLGDLGSPERLDLEFRVRRFEDGEYSRNFRWRGGFSIMNPWRKLPK